MKIFPKTRKNRKSYHFRDVTKMMGITTKGGQQLKKLLIIAALAAIATGCATKSRSIAAKGMYVSESGQLAIGYVDVDAIPEGTDSAVIHYEEDVALLSPSTKTHDIDIILTGTNSVGSAKGIVTQICKAFVQVAPGIAKTDGTDGTAGTDGTCPGGECKDDACKGGECTTGACEYKN